jgi:4-hydroxy-tetrahydrodipicolinate synthase
MGILSGMLPVVPTPFTADRRVDERSLAQLMDWYIEVGVKGAVVLGNSSEVDQLTDDEKFRIIEVAVRTSRGRIPVVAGITSKGVYVSQYLNKKAADLGASAVMLAPPLPYEVRRSSL